MIITKLRILSLARYLVGLGEGEAFTFGVRVAEEAAAVLPGLGFSENWVDGETLLPPASGGTVSLRNAEGWDIVHRDRPMETRYREFDWTWEEFRGPYDRVERSKTVYQPYVRYPRTHVPPPSLELQAVTTPQGRYGGHR